MLCTLTEWVQVEISNAQKFGGKEVSSGKFVENCRMGISWEINRKLQEVP